ncbi:HAD family phosphatase [Brenneria populi subsp. brevivirga]|uniref:HAD family hydrolase n=1 Tax=Brenneria populi TaxID=1505588 RepID=UPI002E196F7D|nr:HAD family phosphatase [Brenneria populi subsp. brevivirga]
MNEPLEKLAAVLFDMDGVLIDSRSIIEQAWREAARMYGRQISDEAMRKHIHGHPGPYTIRTLFSDLPLADQQRVQAHIIHVENTADYNPIPGVAPLIASLGEMDVAVGIVTSGWRQKINRVIALLQAQAHISVIVERDDVSRGKPYPDPYLLAAKRLGIPAGKAVVFEDAKSGVASAVAAGAYCVGIGDEDLMPLGAKLVIPDFREVNVMETAADGAILAFRPDSQVLVERFTAGGRLSTQRPPR